MALFQDFCLFAFCKMVLLLRVYYLHVLHASLWKWFRFIMRRWFLSKKVQKPGWRLGHRFFKSIDQLYLYWCSWVYNIFESHNLEKPNVIVLWNSGCSLSTVKLSKSGQNDREIYAAVMAKTCSLLVQWQEWCNFVFWVFFEWRPHGKGGARHAATTFDCW